MKNFIKKLDIFSDEVKLQLNNQDSRYRNLFNGIISIFTFVSIISFSIYFLSELFYRKVTNLSSTEEFTSNLNTNFTNIPIMLRISDSNSNVLKDKETVWGIKMKFWYGGSVDKKIVNQTNYDIPVEVCDINKHFGEYKYLFSNFTDIDTFYCPVPRKGNQTIYGIYGDVSPFSYYHFYIHMCNNKTSNNTCKSENYIKEYLTNPFLDVRTLDYSLDIWNENPGNMYVRSDRHAISSTVYKRIWMYLLNIKYITDFGYLFKHEDEKSFYQVTQFRYDSDLRNLSTGSSVAGSFTTFTILNFNTRKIFLRSYIKAENVIANIGGLIKLFMTISYSLNYLISCRSTELKLINDTAVDLLIEVGEKNCIDKSTETKMYQNVKNINLSDTNIRSKSNNLEFDKSRINVNSPNVNKNFNNNISEKLVLKRFNKIKFTCLEYLVPIGCFKNKEKMNNFKFYKEIINERLSIVALIKMRNEFDKLKDIMLDKEQNLLINHIPLKYSNSKICDYNKVLRIYNERRENNNNSEVDKRIVSLLIKKFS